ncbi:hypothetical protein AVEN_266597-1 [Araneus ventricosus]|uniref:Uncharacterized protein n=1 Tax=Araneus ventricosus TaxID=182803 RepID=A0A4Y2DZ12_ARAVE|nr:hypothetical protein AVEN_266597-1 [Araneus ventricosus]
MTKILYSSTDWSEEKQLKLNGAEAVNETIQNKRKGKLFEGTVHFQDNTRITDAKKTINLLTKISMGRTSSKTYSVNSDISPCDSRIFDPLKITEKRTEVTRKYRTPKKQSRLSTFKSHGLELFGVPLEL